ncbi:oligosaccharide flippase family protein, partial [Enterococcus faecium]|uniref:oligosaccharide flippase family protein n=1 Tax=Enterococcus faecium TaxID=1352 RepID=UPI003CC6272E
MFFLLCNLTISFMSSIFESYIIANEQFKFQQSILILQSLLLPIITLSLLFLFHIGVLGIVVVQTLVSFCTLIISIHFCLKKLRMKFHFRKIETPLLIEISRFSFFIFLTQIVNQVNNNAPIFILGILADPTKITLFSIANQLKMLFS